MLLPEEVGQIFELGHAADLRVDSGDYQSAAGLKHYWRPGQVASAIGLDAVPVGAIDIGQDAQNITFDDVVLEAPE